ncbi:MAG: hypothetical protein AVDCRST_MAG21-1209 [uncultured Nocardioidaceae bacterium]|uniref:DUF6752 domain-containing protein n=1 Tax=uncultured Nocardioidaceae bacterium TaxID=253824 RepID=A0A6J4MZ35_9ACTN|nr:MAG: hypothetical protein AVDCRST_MAG21-1209 [uncultured Nocardioidaceae bacterium]
MDEQRSGDEQAGGRLGRLFDRGGDDSADDVQQLRHEIAGLQRQTNQLRTKVNGLEEEVQECRRLNRRLAELTDVVQELLMPLSQQDTAGAQEVLQRYSASL